MTASAPPSTPSKPTEAIGCIVITGKKKRFAAGADIGFMKDFDYMHAYKTDFITRNWERIKTARKPVIAAVAGFALGGGCEMAMMCDMIFAADTPNSASRKSSSAPCPAPAAPASARAVRNQRPWIFASRPCMMGADKPKRAASSPASSRPSNCWKRPSRRPRPSPPFRSLVVMMIKESVKPRLRILP